MKRAIFAAAALSLVLAAPALAVEGGQPPTKGEDASFNVEQRKADIIQNIDKRIARLQDEKACVQAAKTRDDLKACWEKFRADERKEREEMMRQRRIQPLPGGQPGQGGQMPPPSAAPAPSLSK